DRAAQGGGQPVFAGEYGTDGLAQFVQAGALWNVAGGAVIEGAADDGGVFVGRDQHDRHGGMLGADGGQAGEAMVARHVQVQQHQVDLVARFEQGQHAIERFGFAGVDVWRGVRSGATQGGAEQRVVVGDEQGGHCGLQRVAGTGAVGIFGVVAEGRAGPEAGRPSVKGTGGGRGRGYCAVQPPSMGMAVPVTLWASRRHSHTAMAPTSSGSDSRWLGCFSESSERTPSSRLPPLRRASICGSISGVSTQPGQMQLTVTPPLSRLPAAAYSSAATLLRPTMPNLLATYGALSFEATRPCTDATLTTRP